MPAQRPLPVANRQAHARRRIPVSDDAHFPLRPTVPTCHQDRDHARTPDSPPAPNDLRRDVLHHVDELVTLRRSDNTRNVAEFARPSKAGQLPPHSLADITRQATGRAAAPTKPPSDSPLPPLTHKQPACLPNDAEAHSLS
ncbi:uncharacterized protein A4U43_C08F26090 [Asparagus officinalis]|nr:uncharacterized protein A4U43_C08F26090 [Asparagus officinalis]